MNSVYRHLYLTTLVVSVLCITIACSKHSPVEQPSVDAPSTNTVTATHNISVLSPSVRAESIKARLSTYERVERDNYQLSSEGAEVQMFLEGDAIRAVTLMLYGEMGKAKFEYFCNEKAEPFFLRRTQYEYDRPFGEITNETVEEVTLDDNSPLADETSDGTTHAQKNDASNQLRIDMLALFDEAVSTL